MSASLCFFPPAVAPSNANTVAHMSVSIMQFPSLKLTRNPKLPFLSCVVPPDKLGLDVYKLSYHFPYLKIRITF